MEKLNSPILSIGTISGAVILSKIDDIKKFDAPNKIVVYVGLDAFINEKKVNLIVSSS